jgi:glycerol-1-phosphate dehydrogenase [NAD(P)+]
MPLLARTINTPLAIEIRRGAIAELGAILVDRRISTGGEVAIVVGPGQGAQIAGLVRPQLTAADVFVVSGGTLDAAQELGTKLQQRSYDAVVGIGGGRTLDTAKWAAARFGLPMVSVATSLAHDGLASPVASLEHDGGRGSYGVQLPIAVIVDLDFVVRGPQAQTRAGIGDALSNLSACADWELAHRARGEPVDGLGLALARSGAEALVNHPGTLTDDGFLTTLAEALTLGGIAMSVCGSSRPCSGGCHEISHALDALHPGAGSHGEQVGFGALFCTFLRGDARFEHLAACLRRHGLPLRPTDFGLTDEEFVAVVVHAPRTRPDRYTILEHLDLSPAEIAGRLKDYLCALGD